MNSCNFPTWLTENPRSWSLPNNNKGKHVISLETLEQVKDMRKVRLPLCSGHGIGLMIQIVVSLKLSTVNWMDIS